MRRRRLPLPRALLLVAGTAVGAGALAGTAHAGRGGALPPLEIELGHAVTHTTRGQHEAPQLLVGLSWASLYPRPTPIDVSVGVVATFAPAPGPRARARATSPVAEPAADGGAAGAFLDVAVRGAAGRHWRTWVGGRGELLDHGEVSGLGCAARASIEVWTGVFAGGHGGAVMGTLALSAWAETGLREQPHREVASFVAAGLGLRLPFVVAR
ncbi:MAG: hypothetical protein KJZ91_25970 [Myxococcales bacterium]|nr:hypothetical protein [Myxococcales bacterium]